jgi:TonB family protein
MARKEKFGKFVLFEELDGSGLGTEFRAAKLSTTGLEKIVSVLRLSPAVSGHAEIAKAVMDQAKVAAQLQSPNITRIYGIGKVESSYYVSTEFVEGKSLKQVFDRCRRDAFPFSIDHGLLIASKVCAALEYSHGRKTDQGGRYFHGLASPRNVLVSYEGEVRVRGFGHWLARVRDAGALQEDDLRYLAPEQSAGQGDFRSDIYGVATILWETLTGKPFADPAAAGDLASRLAGAKLQAPSGDDDKIPKPIGDILARALAADPGARYPEIQEMRKAIDTLLFSGDFTPTTFNLAFFMHSVFRDDIDRESKELKEEREASYAEFLVEPASRTATTPSAAAVATTPVPVVPRADTHHTPSPLPREPHHTPAPASGPVAPDPHPAPAGLSSKQAAAGFTFHKEEGPKSRTPMLAGAGLLIAALVGGGYWYFSMGPGARRTPPAPTTTTLSPTAVAALAKVKELEEKLKAIEEEKAAAEEKAQEEAAAKLEKEAKARGGAVDATALQKAKDDAAKAARAEQERKQQEEKKRLEQEKAAEEARLADERRKAEEAARLAAATSTTITIATTTTTTTTTTTLPPLRPGALVNLTDFGVIPPVPDAKAQPLIYPTLALRFHVEGTVILSALVDETGAVAEIKLVQAAGGKSGLNEAAIEHVKKQRYRPATKDGVPVKVWISVRVPFKLPS